ncbi:MAG: 23S rRNA (uracil(1939)-C(5))-methyltransferase RlmD [Gammaproteobacteria bacterium]|nr:23S rRNA (uracil(1939)-C(5))-methyltransferase RlmD [Gammaproteobacteria bacterium]
MARRLPQFVELRITGVDADGRGLGEIDGRPIRVKNALPGERVRARLLRRRRGEWWGETDAVLVASPARHPAPCPLFPRCGGCAVQQLEGAAQLAAKQARLLELLDASGVEVGRLRPPVAGPSYHYRTKARLGVRLVGDAPLIGFREHLSNRVARMDDCLVLAPRLGRLIEPLKALVSGLSVRDAVPQIELAAGDEGCALVVRHLRPLVAGDVEALRRFALRFGVALLTQAGGPETAALLAAPAGRSQRLGYAIPAFGLYLNFHPSDFTQVNLALNRRLVADVVQSLGSPTGMTADLFCGIGNFSLALARRGHRVLGLEGDGGCIDRAKGNAALNGLGGRCEFSVADLYKAPALPPRLGAVLVDPPRSGLGSALVEALNGRTDRLAYVSCNPATFARDARQLVELGFNLAEAAVYDLFPHTAHIETFGLFER